MANNEKNVSTVDEEFVQNRTLPQNLFLSLRGICMGIADVIPGVSGGTMALILGIYKELIASIRSFDMEALKLLFRRDLKGFIRHTNLVFLVFLLAGIGSAIVSLAKLMPKLLKLYPAQTQGLFFGLVLASIFVVLRNIKKHTPITAAFLVGGTLLAYWVVGLIPRDTSSSLLFIYVAGAIAICAMILPGLSGAFLLLVMGKYEFILNCLTNTLKNGVVAIKSMKLGLLFNQDLAVVVVFVLGCISGLMAFSRLLSWLLKRHEAFTLAVLTGLMLGSLRKIWPFQENIRVEMVHKKLRVLEYANVWPKTWSSTEFLAIGLLVFGFVLVLSLEWLVAPKMTEQTKKM